MGLSDAEDSRGSRRRKRLRRRRDSHAGDALAGLATGMACGIIYILIHVYTG
jgi:hypothetical protein